LDTDSSPVRLLKNAHLRRCPHSSSLQRTFKYASLLRISGALHLGIFDQPGENEFFKISCQAVEKRPCLPAGRHLSRASRDYPAASSFPVSNTGKAWCGVRGRGRIDASLTRDFACLRVEALGFNRSLLNRSEEVNGKLSAPNEEEISADGMNNRRV